MFDPFCPTADFGSSASIVTSDNAGSSQILLTCASSGNILEIASFTSSSVESMLGWGLITTLLLIALAIFTVRLFPPAPPKEAGSFVMINMEPASKSTS